jgi:hypothetical protein
MVKNLNEKPVIAGFLKTNSLQIKLARPVLKRNTQIYQYSNLYHHELVSTSIQILKID